MSKIKRIDELVLFTKGLEYQSWSNRKRDLFLNHCIEYWRKEGFPYYNLNDEELIREIRNLKKYSYNEIINYNKITMKMTGLRVVNNFHPHMWEVKIKDMASPLERFSSDKHLKRIINRSMLVWRDRYGANHSNLRRMLRSYSRTASVSNFRPTVAKAIIEKYTSKKAKVLDFAAGYGGRLLGTLACDRTYIGIDPSLRQIEGNQKLLDKIATLKLTNSKGVLINGCSEDVMPTIKSGSIDLILTSPPYFDQEHYELCDKQSFIKYPNYEFWLSNFLKPVIEESRRTLKKKGIFAINISNTKDYDIEKDFITYAKRIFVLKKKLKMQLGLLPYLRNKFRDDFKYESIYILEKIK